MSQEAKKLVRLPREGMIAGVAAGFAKYYDMDVTVMRLIFVLITFVSGGAGFIAYIILAVVMPTAELPQTAKLDIDEKIETLAADVTSNGRAQRFGNMMGLVLVVFGFWLLLGEFFPGWFDLRWSVVWPMLLVLLGAWMLIRAKRS